MEFKAYGLTDTGLKRKSNQDCILIDKELGLFIVADGIGGHSGGEVASKMATSVCRDYIFKHKASLDSEDIDPGTLIVDSYKEASSEIYRYGSEKKIEYKGMGTTMVAVLLFKDILYIANTGDSRAYLFKDSHLWQVTEDHSLVYEQIKAGIIDKDSSLSRNIITRSIGFEKNVLVDLFQRELQKGEQILLCSDGLNGVVSDEIISKTLKVSKLSEAPRKLIDLANKGGGSDNISVVIVSF